MNKKLDIYLAGPRGFCAGVERAILMVQEAIKKYGSPVYVRHEIVHNKYVVDNLKAEGAIFVEELDEVSPGPDDLPDHGADLVGAVGDAPWQVRVGGSGLVVA